MNEIKDVLTEKANEIQDTVKNTSNKIQDILEYGDYMESSVAYKNAVSTINNKISYSSGKKTTIEPLAKLPTGQCGKLHMTFR